MHYELGIIGLTSELQVTIIWIHYLRPMCTDEHMNKFSSTARPVMKLYARFTR